MQGDVARVRLRAYFDWKISDSDLEDYSCCFLDVDSFQTKTFLCRVSHLLFLLNRC